MAATRFPKIDLYANGVYQVSTGRYPTCAAAIAGLVGDLAPGRRSLVKDGLRYTVRIDKEGKHARIRNA